MKVILSNIFFKAKKVVLLLSFPPPPFSSYFSQTTALRIQHQFPRPVGEGMLVLEPVFPVFFPPLPPPFPPLFQLLYCSFRIMHNDL
eukprot:TRINITY_DN38095_c0_g1_i1.p1 TRINITY_DN38095_c0_g1~~TRINITY_DN38095_c0_g1_i1.p1  ORF type:complete len:101 (+),score=10.08 TRINITY_DN38095_c0_g1_i1:45-305(+)